VKAILRKKAAGSPPLKCIFGFMPHQPHLSKAAHRAKEQKCILIFS
jgi:hypothetical protein